MHVALPRLLKSGLSVLGPCPAETENRRITVTAGPQSANAVPWVMGGAPPKREKPRNERGAPTPLPRFWCLSQSFVEGREKQRHGQETRPASQPSDRR
ncbi:hypothetical protein GQ607_000354 [Colletotrichum asianum]|uniref:Uncharacterized protein n=1 Tax=Colletotrichum asianum TaxID=702518 RepID=A0A8H3WQG4_9PEZI|nr:hypothetical protein GQ607_000354 [Colletotrichum asianum]